LPQIGYILQELWSRKPRAYELFSAFENQTYGRTDRYYLPTTLFFIRFMQERLGTANKTPGQELIIFDSEV
jgi:hypothetical protein